MKHTPTPVIERLLARICVDEQTGCWLWQGTTIKAGHGRITLGRREEGTALVHRVTYEHMVGPVPEGLELDHVCRVPACVNPDHLEPVTHGENIFRGDLGSRRIVCPRGHYILGDNVYIYFRVGSDRPERNCKICNKASARASTARETAARRARKAALNDVA